MRSGWTLGLVTAALLGVAPSSADAGLPCAAYSSAGMELKRQDLVGGFPCLTCDLMWCPLPPPEHEIMFIRVTVRDCLEAPVPACDVRLDLSGEFDPNDDLPASNNGRICGTPSRTGTTDESGAVAFVISGGGSGRFAIHWGVAALCSDLPIELAAGDDTLCIKSVDFNGSGNVNFQDTFQYAPKLAAGQGYSADLRHCSSGNWVSFTDTFIYAPHLSYLHACPGGAGQSFVLTKPAGGIPPDCDVIF